MKLREFLYLDDGLTTQYLAQLDGGEMMSEERSESSTKLGSAGIKGNLAGVGGDLSKEKSSEASTSISIRATPEAKFAKLESTLEAADSLQYLDAFDQEIWDQLSRGELLLIEGTVEIPEIYRQLEALSSFGPLAALAEAAGEEIDDETGEGIAMMTMMQGLVQHVPVIARAAGAPKYKFVGKLKEAAVVDSLSELDGECVIVAAMKRRFKSGEKHSMMDTMGFTNVMPKAQLREIERDMKKDMPGAVISGPAAHITPLAIYR